MYLIESKCSKVFVLSVLLLVLSFGFLSTQSYATTTGAGTVMKITSDTSNISIGQEFIVNVEIDNPQDYYAGDISIAYDDDMFELKGVGVADTSQLKIYGRTNETTGAGTRIIVASKGAENVIASDQKVLRLKFKAIDQGNQGYIGVTKARVADGYGREYSINVSGGYFNVGGDIAADTNGDGEISIGDLAIASRMMGADDWEIYNPDVDHDGQVTDDDLSKIVLVMLNS